MILKKDKIEKENVIIENMIFDSSNVIKTSYNFNTKQLYVTFHRGGVYYYNGVDKKTYEEIYDTPSIGSYINKIKKEYQTHKIGDVQSEDLTILKEEVVFLKKELDNS